MNRNITMYDTIRDKNGNTIARLQERGGNLQYTQR